MLCIDSLSVKLGENINVSEAECLNLGAKEHSGRDNSLLWGTIL